MKTYLVLWNEGNELQINPFNSYKEAKWYKKFIDKDKKPTIIKVHFPVVCW